MGYSQLLRGDRAKARKLLMEAEQALPGDKLVAANIALLNKS
jgi:Flp pilus assembly protein TadD